MDEINEAVIANDPKRICCIREFIDINDETIAECMQLALYAIRHRYKSCLKALLPIVNRGSGKTKRGKNLLSEAVKYCPVSTAILLQNKCHANDITLSVALDHGQYEAAGMLVPRLEPGTLDIVIKKYLTDDKFIDQVIWLVHHGAKIDLATNVAAMHGSMIMIRVLTRLAILKTAGFLVSV